LPHLLYQFFKKVISSWLVKNAQMHGSRNPSELRGILCPPQMGVFQQPAKN